MFNSTPPHPQWERDPLELYPFEVPGAWGAAQEINLQSPFSEFEEIELAAEFLQIRDEAELDQFLGNLIKGAWRGIRKIGGKILRPLGAALKFVGKRFLPVITGAVGSLIPGVGTALGSAAGALISRALEAELEGIGPEDRKFEMVQRFVRLAGATAAKVASMPPNVAGQEAVWKAMIEAARQQVHLPTADSSFSRPSRGRWQRRGSTIILMGLEQ